MKGHYVANSEERKKKKDRNKWEKLSVWSKTERETEEKGKRVREKKRWERETLREMNETANEWLTARTELNWAELSWGKQMIALSADWKRKREKERRW